MRTIFKNLFILASLLLASLTASAQKVIVQDLETWMSSLISRAIDNKVEVNKSFGQERDIQKEGTPLKWRCDIMTFTLPKKQRPLLDEMIKAFEENGHNNPNCYGINTLTAGNVQNEGRRNLMIGEDPNRYVTIGESSENYININILDASDTTKTHRYAYALEWQDGVKGKTYVRYIVTYAKIPSAFTSYKGTVKYPSFSGEPPSIPRIIKGIRSHRGEFQQAPDKAQAWYLGKGKPVRIEHQLSVSNGDTLFAVKGTDGVWIPKDSADAINDMLDDEIVLLMFSNLKQYYNNHQNAELTAISIYTLCKHANEQGFFTASGSLEELEQLICEMDSLIEVAKTDTDRKYFQMAREQLSQILKKHK
ncbi:MAG: hypothetical protein J6W52_10625 [Bacteroidaceae bacterium]|nr:hypothetical protein [Bacteroidaceae bacterium]